MNSFTRDRSTALPSTSFSVGPASYTCLRERPCSIKFHPNRATKVQLLEVPYDAKSPYIVYNSGDSIHAVPADDLDNVPLRSIPMPSGGHVTCFALADARGTSARILPDADLLVGMADGTVFLVGMRKCLESTPQTKPIIRTVMDPPDGNGNASHGACVAVGWIPRTSFPLSPSSPSLLLAPSASSAATSSLLPFLALANGSILIYDALQAREATTTRGGRTPPPPPPSTPPSSSSAASSPVASHPHASRSGGGMTNVRRVLDVGTLITDVAIAPDGTKLAVTSKRGALWIYDTVACVLTGGCQAFFGGLLCAAWSPDARLVAAGGEDDLVLLYDVEQGGVAFGQGHEAWVSGVAFFPSPAPLASSPSSTSPPPPPPPPPPTRSYHLASVGQDCRLAIWEVHWTDEVMEESVAARHAAAVAQRGREKDSGRRGGRRNGNLYANGTGQDREGQGHDQGSGPGGMEVLTGCIPRRWMVMMRPVGMAKAHVEPASGVWGGVGGVVTADCCAGVRVWRREGGDE